MQADSQVLSRPKVEDLTETASETFVPECDSSEHSSEVQGSCSLAEKGEFRKNR